MDILEILVGNVGRPCGTRGEVHVDLRTDEPEHRFAPQTGFDTVQGRLTVAGARWHGGRFVVRFAEVADRTAAGALRGVELLLRVPADESPDDPDEYYDHQLVGLQAVEPGGTVLGEVVDVLHLPAQDLLVVRHDDKETLVPFLVTTVPAVDVPRGRLVVDDAAGLFDP